MEDMTAAVIRLERSYESMQIAKKRVADEVRAEFRQAIRDEISRRQRSLETEFAKELALENARGLPGSVIRSKVLRTQDWARWKKWRDLAEIEPERVLIANAKAEAEIAKQGYRYEDGILTLFRDHKEQSMEPLEIDVAAWKDKDDPKAIPTAVDQGAFDKFARATGEPFVFLKYVSEILRGL